MWMYIVGAVVLALVILLFSPIVISFSFGESVQVTLRYLFIGWTVYPRSAKTKPKKKREKKKQAKKPAPKTGVVQKVKEIFGVLTALFQGSLRLLENARVRKLKITLGIAGEDAAKAAVNYGLVCSVVYPFLGLADNHMNLKKPKVNIYCEYLSRESLVEGSGKIYIWAYHAVGTALFILKELVSKNIKHKRW